MEVIQQKLSKMAQLTVCLTLGVMGNLKNVTGTAVQLSVCYTD